jgi:hypothetical protein
MPLPIKSLKQSEIVVFRPFCVDFYTNILITRNAQHGIVPNDLRIVIETLCDIVQRKMGIKGKGANTITVVEQKFCFNR